MIWFDDLKLAREQYASRLRHKNNPRHKVIIPSDATEKELSHAIAVTPPPKRKKKPYKKRQPRKIPTKQLDFSKVARFAAMRVEGTPEPEVSQSPQNSVQSNPSNMSEVHKMPLHTPQSGPTKKINRVPVLPEEHKKSFERPKAVYDNHKSYYGIYADIQKDSLKKSG